MPAFGRSGIAPFFPQGRKAWQRSPEEITHRGILEESRDGLAHFFPAVVNRTGRLVRALGTAKQAAPTGGVGVERTQDFGEGKLVGGAGEAKAASGSAFRDQNPIACQAVEDLGEVVSGNAEGIGDLAGAEGSAGVLAGEVEESAERVFGGLRDHGCVELSSS